MDITVFIFRFIFGTILGGVLTTLPALPVTIAVIWLGEPKVIKLIIIIWGAITLLVAISATIWGDRFLIGFMRIFIKIFKYF